ncbi:MAG: hypothetical protein D6694_13305 [Gammaproteobacteria bacterium]|nr:MAG: hypothetical protein D6694_13305 [Gammaproteobacteria bacterium]
MACITVFFSSISLSSWARTPSELKVIEKSLQLDSIEISVKNEQNGRLQRMRIKWGKEFNVSLDGTHMPKKLLDELRKYTVGRILSPVRINLNQATDGGHVMHEMDIMFFIVDGKNIGDSGVDNDSISKLDKNDDICPYVRYITISVNLDWKTFYASIQCGAELIFIRCPEFGPCH